MAAGLSALRLVKKLNIEDHVLEMEKIFFKRLKNIQRKSKYIGDVRGRGMMFAVEYIRDKKTKEPFPELAKEARKACYENGLLVEIGGYYDNVVRFLPPLIATKKIIENGLNLFEKANIVSAEKYKQIYFIKINE